MMTTLIDGDERGSTPMHGDERMDDEHMSYHASPQFPSKHLRHR